MKAAFVWRQHGRRQYVGAAGADNKHGAIKVNAAIGAQQHKAASHHHGR
jgi:hypothetical protein